MQSIENRRPIGETVNLYCMHYLSMLPFFKKMVLTAVCMALPSAIPKDRRGMRCTNPFCDFECVRMENCNMGDMGADIDIDEGTVSNVHACKHCACQTLRMLCR